MPQNKFWLVWREDGDNPKYRHATQESALKEAKKLSSKFTNKEFYVIEATHHCKADVNVIATLLVSTPEGSLSVTEQDDIISVKPVLGLPTNATPKFEVGDRVLLDNYYDCIVDDYIDATKSYKVSIMGGGYKIANEVRVSRPKQ